MAGRIFRCLTLGALLGASVLAAAGNDGQARVNELLGSSPEYRESWSKVVRKEERLPEWVMNLTGASEQMVAETEDKTPYLVGPLCESADTCLQKRLFVAVSLDKSKAYGLLVEVPSGLPADKSPTRHASYRFLGDPDDGMQNLLREQLKKDPKWY